MLPHVLPSPLMLERPGLLGSECEPDLLLDGLLDGTLAPGCLGWLESSGATLLMGVPLRACRRGRAAPARTFLIFKYVL